MNIVQVAHALVDSYVFQKSVVHSDYEALAREIVTVLSACEYAAYERAAQVADEWGAGSSGDIPAAEFERRHGHHRNLAAAIRALV